MDQQRGLPVTIEGYVPGQLERRWCATCGTMDGFRIPFVKAVSNTDPEAPGAVAAEGCFTCNERHRQAAPES